MSKTLSYKCPYCHCYDHKNVEVHLEHISLNCNHCERLFYSCIGLCSSIDFGKSDIRSLNFKCSVNKSLFYRLKQTTYKTLISLKRHLHIFHTNTVEVEDSHETVDMVDSNKESDSLMVPNDFIHAD